MGIILYFAKVNINSHIQEVYKEQKSKNEVLDNIFNKIRDNAECINKKTIKKGKKLFFHNVKFYFSSIEKIDNDGEKAIYGKLVKESTVPIKQKNRRTGTVEAKEIEYIEEIPFYFNLYKEVISFYTANRFKQKEIPLALKQLINFCTSDENEIFNFEVALLRKGLKVEEIKEELGKLGKLKQLKITIIPPNVDDDILDEIIAKADGEVKNLKEGNLTEYVVEFTSRDKDGINLNATLINDELDKVGNIHSKITSEQATSKEYVRVEGRTISGENYSTKKGAPITQEVGEEYKNKELFIQVSNKYISILCN